MKWCASVGGGGFDDFGAALAAAAEARSRAAVQQASSQVQQQPVLQQSFSRSSTTSSISISTADASNTGQAGVQNSYTPVVQTSLSTTSTLTDAGVSSRQAAVPTGWATQDEVMRGVQYAARQSAEEAVLQASAANGTGHISSETGGLQPALAMYSFLAELDNELSIYTGDVLQLGPEVDGWYQATRVTDGATGLVPASYVRLLESAGQE